MPRLYREAPLNGIWEGSGNVQALDVLRALQPRAGRGRRRSAPRSTWPRAPTAGSTPPGGRWTPRSPTRPTQELRARRVVEQLALVLQGSLLVRHAPAAVADAFCAGRLAGDGVGLAYGTLPAGPDLAGVLARALPES